MNPTPRNDSTTAWWVILAVLLVATQAFAAYLRARVVPEPWQEVPNRARIVFPPASSHTTNPTGHCGWCSRGPGNELWPRAERGGHDEAI